MNDTMVATAVIVIGCVSILAIVMAAAIGYAVGRMMPPNREKD